MKKRSLKQRRVNQCKYLTTRMKIENNECNNEKSEDDDGYFALSFFVHRVIIQFVKHHEVRYLETRLVLVRAERIFILACKVREHP